MVLIIDVNGINHLLPWALLEKCELLLSILVQFLILAGFIRGAYILHKKLQKSRLRKMQTPLCAVTQEKHSCCSLEAVRFSPRVEQIKIVAQGAAFIGTHYSQFADKDQELFGLFQTAQQLLLKASTKPTPRDQFRAELIQLALDLNRKIRSSDRYSEQKEYDQAVASIIYAALIFTAYLSGESQVCDWS